MNEGIKLQYAVLANLTKEDEKIVRLNAELSKLPAQITRLQGSLTSRREAVLKARQASDAAEKTLRSLESDLRDREENIRKAESKMMEVKTNDEYRAAAKENEGQKKSKALMEETALSIMTELENQKKILDAAEAAFKEYEATVLSELAQLQTQQGDTLGEIQRHSASRNEAAKNLTPEISDIYFKIIGRTKGVAVAPIENSLCLGCNVRLRPQLYNEVLGFVAIHRCPSCGRILIRPGEATQPSHGLSN